jgi:phage terminase small subunit
MNKVQKAPKGLKHAGRSLWKSVVATFTMEPHDLVILECLCQTLDRKNTAEDELRKLGKLTFENRHGEAKPYPQIQVIRDCNVLIARLRRELALSEIGGDDEAVRVPRLVYGGKR